MGLLLHPWLVSVDLQLSVERSRLLTPNDVLGWNHG